MNSVYNFKDTTLVLRHPAMGSLTITGEGVGSVTLSYANDNTQHDVAADGSVMISKINAHNGTLAITVQQTSYANRWLERYMNYIKVAPTSEWAAANASLDNDQIGDHFELKGISPQKAPDHSYQAAGQNKTWNMMAAEIVQG